jgi:protein-S-isoprenylcysteine O-methyltransferase Ste14
MPSANAATARTPGLRSNGGRDENQPADPSSKKEGFVQKACRARDRSAIAALERSKRPMSRMTAGLGTALFLFIGPGLSVVLIPWLISRWQVKPSILDLTWLKFVGVVLIVLGVCVVLDSFARYALRGTTPAPLFRSRHLVVTGLYRNVRNPLYLASTAMIFGQALLFANAWLFLYGTALWLYFHSVVVFSEEPALRKTFGSDCDRYVANVRRWWPRLQA